MLYDVVEAFLNDAIDIDLGFGRKQSVNRVYLRGETNLGGGGDLGENEFDSLRQTKIVQLVGTQVVGNLSHFVDCHRSGLGNIAQLLFSTVLLLKSVESHKRGVLDDNQVL